MFFQDKVPTQASLEQNLSGSAVGFKWNWIRISWVNTSAKVVDIEDNLRKCSKLLGGNIISFSLKHR